MDNLAVVTSVTGGYGRWLADWARSIAAQTVKPGLAVLVVHGSAADAQHVPIVRAILDEAGIPFIAETIEDRIDFGDARNRAVELAEKEWVMHLDADDVIFPHCIETVAKLAPEADVVSLGYKRFGDLASGPGNLHRLYRNLTGEEALHSAAPASGVSPFRRTFWERSPYRSGMKGAWDTALWIGFARLGARFRATRTECFGYRQHGDSVFNRRRKTFDFTRAHVQAELRALRKDWQGVTVIIPHRGDNGPRDRALEIVKGFYAQHFPEWQVLVGRDSGSGLWSKGAAIDDALQHATGAILVIADGDSMVDPAVLGECAMLVASDSAPWAMPHRMVYRLSEEDSKAYVAQAPAAGYPFLDPDEGDLLLTRPAYEGFQGGGFIVVRRDRWNATGGIPREFVGWGCEDNAIGVILNTMLGPCYRGDSKLVHLWHPHAKTGKNEPLAITANRKRFRPYREANKNPEAMWKLIDPQSLGDKVDAASGVIVRRSAPKAVVSPREANAQPVRDTRAETRRIRAEQQVRNIEANALRDAVLAKSREARLASKKSPQ